MIAFYENHDLPFSYRCGDNLDFPAHLHKQMEILFVTQGRLCLGLPAGETALVQGDCALLFPNAVHAYRSDRDNRYLLLIFDSEMAGEYAATLRHCHPLHPVIPQAADHPDISFCLKALERESDRALLRGYLTVLLGRLLHGLPLEERRGDLDLTARMLSYIMAHYTQPISLGSLAQEMGVSASYLSRIFAQKIGCNYNSYINSLRVSLARHLLADPSRTVNQVGQACGFESSRSFQRAFRLLCGEPPGRYRRRSTSGPS